MSMSNDQSLAMATTIVAAYVSHNPVSMADLPQLIAQVSAAAAKACGLEAAAVVETKVAPAMPLREAVKPDSIGCLHCGKRYKSLKRHLRTHHDQSPAAYRETFGLAASSPMVAPRYSEIRAGLAKKFGLGLRGGVHVQ